MLYVQLEFKTKISQFLLLFERKKFWVLVKLQNITVPLAKAVSRYSKALSLLYNCKIIINDRLLNDEKSHFIADCLVMKLQ